MRGRVGMGVSSAFAILSLIFALLFAREFKNVEEADSTSGIQLTEESGSSPKASIGSENVNNSTAVPVSAGSVMVLDGDDTSAFKPQKHSDLALSEE